MNLQSISVLLQRPLYMLGNEFGLRLLTCLECCNDARRRRSIPKRYGDITQPAFVADAAYGAAFGFLEPGLLTPSEYLDRKSTRLNSSH